MIKRLFNNEIAFETILNTTLEAVITSDKKGDIVYINEATTKLFGYEKEELIGSSVKKLMPSYHSRQHDSHMSNYRETKNAKVIGKGRKVTAKKKNGDLFTCWLGLSELDVDGEHYFTAIMSDISELEKANQELESLNKSLEIQVARRTNELKGALKKANELNELKSKFLTLASHEFKTPLATILSSAILIKKYDEPVNLLNEKQQKHIHRIQNSVDLLTSILEEFINIEKIELNKIEKQYTTFSLNEVIEEAVELIDVQKKEGQSIEVNYRTEPRPITSDAHLVLYILLNLLSNAVKYSKENQPIYIEYNESPTEINIAVIDNGIGIPEANQKHIFERFFRADNAKSQKGTGIGLHIAKKYAQLLGGDIHFQSRYNNGSHFNFILPITEK